MTLPSATTTLEQVAGPKATGSDLVTILAAVPTNADITPRLYARADDIETQHGYSQGLDRASVFIAITNLPVLFVGLPIDVQGAVGRFDVSGNSNTSVVTVAAGGDGSLEVVRGICKVVTGGIVGTAIIKLSISLDGGHVYKSVRLGTANSYVIPKVGQTLSFAAGSLTAGETALTWSSTAPTASNSDITLAKTALKNQAKLSRAWFLAYDIEASSDISQFKTEVDAYETSDDRYVQGYAGIRSKDPQAELSQLRVWMTGSPAITFADAGGADTITRAAGSFTTDGFTTGDTVVIAGAVAGGGANNVTAVPDTFAALVLTLGAADPLQNEGPIAGVTIYATPTLTFVDGGAGVDTIVRNRGSWFNDGFRVGDSVAITGTASNNYTAVITVLTATTMTFITGTVVAEVIGSYGVTIISGATYAVDVAAMEIAFATVTSDQRIEISYGRLWYSSPVTGYKLRYPVALADMIRSFQRDLSETTWEKGVGSLANWGMTDPDGLPFEYDERLYLAAEPAGFTCARTWASDASGAPYIAVSQTRQGDQGVLLQSHYARVGNLAQTVAQADGENIVGSLLVTKRPDSLGRKYATTASLATIETKFNTGLTRALGGTTRRGIGPRASQAVYTAATDDDFAASGAKLNGSIELNVLGTIFTVLTAIRIQ